MLKIAHDKIYNHPLKENHRFPMIKYELIPEQLLIENTCNENNFFRDTLEPSLLYDSYMKKYLEFLEKVDISKDENIFDNEDRTVYLFKYIKGNQRIGLFKQPKEYDRMKLPEDVLFGIKKKTNKEFAKNYP